MRFSRKFKTGNKVHYRNGYNLYVGVFKIIKLDERFDKPTYILENDGNPDHFGIYEDQLTLADPMAKVGRAALAQGGGE